MANQILRAWSTHYMKKRIAWILLLLPIYCFADTYYVDDTLRVGIRADASNDGPSIAVVTTGTKLELLERQGAYSKVVSPAGVEGWVRSAYLSRQKPASLLLSEANSNIKSLEKEINKLRSQGSNASAPDPTLQETIKQLETERDNLAAEMLRLKEEVEETTQQNDTPELITTIANMDATPIYIALGSLVFLLSLGFLFGVSWHKHQVTKRLGGLSL